MSNRKNSAGSAIVRPPGANFAAGLTTVELGVPDHATALKQHEAYCQALESCGLTLTRLDADERFPDSTFVEDTAILTANCAILTCPGASNRSGEVAGVATILSKVYPAIPSIEAPGTLDGGDVCEAGNHFFIGISARTNEAGAQQLAELLSLHDYTSSFIDIRGVDGILHLKSGLAYLDRNNLVVIDALANREEFRDFELVRVNAAEEYAANCLYLDDRVLVAAGYPGLEGKLRRLGYETIPLEMSEFQKMDGGLSCLSLRFLK